MNLSMLGFSSFVTSRVVGTVVVGRVVGTVVVGRVVVVGGIIMVVVVVVVVLVVLVVSSLVVVVAPAVVEDLPWDRERLYATTARSTSRRDQGRLCKALLDICSLASHPLSYSWAPQN